MLPSKPKISYRYLKSGIEEFHRKYVLVTADKAANNGVVVLRLHYIDTLKQELSGTKAYEQKKRSLSSITIFSIMPPGLLKVLMKTKKDFLHSIGHLNCTKTYKARFMI